MTVDEAVKLATVRLLLQGLSLTARARNVPGNITLATAIAKWREFLEGRTGADLQRQINWWFQIIDDGEYRKVFK